MPTPPFYTFLISRKRCPHILYHTQIKPQHSGSTLLNPSGTLTSCLIEIVREEQIDG